MKATVLTIYMLMLISAELGVLTARPERVVAQVTKPSPRREMTTKPASRAPPPRKSAAKPTAGPPKKITPPPPRDTRPQTPRHTAQIRRESGGRSRQANYSQPRRRHTAQIRRETDGAPRRPGN